MHWIEEGNPQDNNSTIKYKWKQNITEKELEQRTYLDSRMLEKDEQVWKFYLFYKINIIMSAMRMH